MNSKFEYTNYRRVSHNQQKAKLEEAALEYKLDRKALLEDGKVLGNDLYNLRHSSLQDKFLSGCIRDSLQVRLFLLNESVEQGEIIAFDNWVILFKNAHSYSLIYKAALCFISPLKENEEIVLNEEAPAYQSLPSRLAKDKLFQEFYHKQQAYLTRPLDNGEGQEQAAA